MAQEQTAYEGGDISVLVNVIGSTGAHVAATISTSTTRIDGFSTVPTVTTVSTGIYKINFASVTPAPSEGDRLVVKVNGDISGTAWSEYGIPVKIVADERGTDNASTFDASTDTVTTDAASRTASQADVSSLATATALSGVESKIDTLDANVDSILVDTGTDIPTSIAALNDFDPATQSVTASNMRGTDNALLSSQAPSNFSNLGISGSGYINRVVLVDTTTTNSDMRGTDSANTVAPDNSSISAIKAKTDQMVFTVSGQIDANALTGGGGATAAEVYTYFVTGSNADALKADVSSLASQASVDTVDGVVDAIKVKTDQLTFTTPNSVDATATADVDESAIADAVLAGIGGNDVTISSPVASDGTTITIVRGDDYNASDTRAITWTGDSDDQWPSLSGATLKFTASNKMDSMTSTPTVTQPTGSQAFRMELTKDDTEIMSGRYKYDVQATLSSGRVITLVVGEMIVKQTYTDRP